MTRVIRVHGNIMVKIIFSTLAISAIMGKMRVKKTEPFSLKVLYSGKTPLRKSKLTLLNRSIPVFLLLVTILAFGLLIPWLGYYWDDWAKILVSRFYGLSGYFAYYAEDRPLSAWTHIVFTPLVGQGPLGWQILTLLLRWLSGWGMLWSLNNLWPQARRQNLVAVVLFLIYPVFAQQPVALTFHQQWLQYALFFVSLGSMISAWRLPERRSRKFILFTTLAIVTMLLQLSVTEYFAPLELIRPVVLWILLIQAVNSPSISKIRLLWGKISQVLRAWAPYLIILAVYSVWRLFLIKLPGEDPYRANTLFELFSHPLATISKYAVILAVDEGRILVTSWTDLLQINLTQTSPFIALSYAVGLVAGSITAFYLVFLEGFGWKGQLTQPVKVESKILPQSIKECKQWAHQAVILGLIGVLLGPVPAWITGRQVVFDFHSDRYAMPAMFGAALLTMLIIEWLAQPRIQRAVLVGVLIALAVSYHLRVANDYRWLWTDQMRVYWQLYWRAPGLKPDTAIFFENEPFPNQGLFSTSSAINLLYPQAKATDPEHINLDYWVYTIRPRYTHAPDTPVIDLSTQFRTLKYTGATPNSLVLYKDPSKASCLWVLSAEDENNPVIPDLVKAFLPVANPDQILASPSPGEYPPEVLFGPEPEHDWCYYFEKASLARQMKDWQEVARLADEAMDEGYLPSTPGSNSVYEWQPFIEGLANNGRWEEAALLTQLVYQRDSHSGDLLCGLWRDGLSSEQGGGEAMPSILDVKTELGCSW
jgi:hypothetical protein